MLAKCSLLESDACAALIGLDSIVRISALPRRRTRRRLGRYARQPYFIKDEYKTARVIGQLEAAQDLHQIVNLASGGGPTRFKVLLHTQAREKRQDHTG
jgi:hypothetical protein